MKQLDPLNVSEALWRSYLFWGLKWSFVSSCILLSRATLFQVTHETKQPRIHLPLLNTFKQEAFTPQGYSLGEGKPLRSTLVYQVSLWQDASWQEVLLSIPAHAEWVILSFFVKLWGIAARAPRGMYECKQKISQSIFYWEVTACTIAITHAVEDDLCHVTDVNNETGGKQVQRFKWFNKFKP